MKILIFNEAATPAGGEMNYYVFDVASRLRAAGETVALVHSRLPKSEFRGTGYIFDHLRKMGAAPDEVRTRLEAILDDFKPDVIQLHGVPNLALDPWLNARTPTVRWIHNHRFYCSGESMTWAWPRQACQRPHAAGCLALHLLHGCGSPNPANNLYQYGRVSRSLAALRQSGGLQVASRMLGENLVRNGIDPSLVEHLPLYAHVPWELKKGAQSPMPTQRRFILHPGGLVRHKGVWLLVRNLGELPEDVDIVFAGGGGDLEAGLKQYVARHSLSERVRIMGSLAPAQWSQLLHQASLVAIPSLWNEPLGLAGIYAMAHGKPVVAFHGNGIDEWIENDHTGIEVPFGARGDFIKAVVSLLNDPPRLEKLGAQARARWNERFRPEHHVEKLRAYYAKVAARREEAKE